MHPPSESGLERVHHHGITPLELSDLWVEGATLWEWSQDARFAAVLRRALGQWRDGDRADFWNESAPAGVAGFEAVFLTGGRTQDPALRAELSGLAQPVVFAEEPVFAGELGGFELLRARGFSGWVVDLGKSQLKISAPDWRGVFPRDWRRLPPSGEVSRNQILAQRRRLREFIALKLQAVLTESNVCPRAMVFALPTRLDHAGTPEASGYAGMRGDRTLVRDAAALGGLPDLSLFVLNDAELAALGALSEARLAGFGKVLVLTLGFGIGAALIQRAASTSPGQPSVRRSCGQRTALQHSDMQQHAGFECPQPPHLVLKH